MPVLQMPSELPWWKLRGENCCLSFRAVWASAFPPTVLLAVSHPAANG
jgi:hypothetical protein